MSQTETRTPLNLHDDIIEHNAVHPLPTVLEQEPPKTADNTDVVLQKEVTKREQARQQREALQAEQAKLQKLLDELDDDSDQDIAVLKTQVKDLQEEVARWTKPDNHHEVFAHIGIFCLVASLLCWFIGPLFANQSQYLDGAIETAAVLLGYVAAGLLLFVQTQKH